LRESHTIALGELFIDDLRDVVREAVLDVLAEAEMTNRKITIIASLGKAELQRGAAIKA
jgi:hypothetical protein